MYVYDQNGQKKKVETRGVVVAPRGARGAMGSAGYSDNTGTMSKWVWIGLAIFVALVLIGLAVMWRKNMPMKSSMEFGKPRFGFRFY